MAPERPFPALIDTGNSYPKTGLFPAVRRRFDDGAPPLDHHHKRGQVATTSRIAAGFGAPRQHHSHRAPWSEVPQVHTNPFHPSITSARRKGVLCEPLYDARVYTIPRLPISRAMTLRSL